MTAAQILDAHTAHSSDAQSTPSVELVEEVAAFVPSPLVPPFVEELLGFWAETLDDIEGLRKATANRHRSLTRDDEWGHGLSDLHPGVAAVSDHLDQFTGFEKSVVKQLELTMKDHPLGPWVKNQKGLGLKTVARYLAAVGGDPAWHPREGRLRSLRELWAYSGLHVVNGQAPVRRRGEQGNWNDGARMRAWNIAQPIIKGKGPYREVYDETRAKYAEAVHQTECRRCGPSGKPAQPGSTLNPGHQHARAIRAIAKAVTKDLWTEARRLHLEADTA